MATFGSLGGLGGMGASYPTRFGAPTSQTVDYLPDATGWLTDWQARYDAEAAKRGQGATAGGPSRDEYIRQMVGNVARQDAANPTYSPTLWQGNDAADLISYFNGDPRVIGGQTIGRDTQEQVWRHGLGDSLFDSLRNYNPAAPSAGYVPDFTALNAEKTAMQPRLEAQTANTQAYGNLTGNGMIGGILGADYELPDFGQVTGEFGQSTAGAGANTGVDMGWTDGAYRAGGANAGVYAPNPYNTRRWGL